MTTLRQINLSGGEIAPALYPRVDTSKNQAGFKTFRNYITRKDGASENRSGGAWKSVTAANSKAVNIRFESSVYNGSTRENDLQIELTNQKIRIIKEGVPVTDPDAGYLAITAVTKANPIVITYSEEYPSAEGDYANGTVIRITGVVGMDELNTRTFRISALNTATNTFSLQDESGNAINSSTFDTWISGGIIRPVLEIVTPYLEADLQFIDYGQSIDVLTLVHNSYHPKQLTMISYPDDWDFQDVDFPLGGPPGDISGLTTTYAGVGTVTVRNLYAVTSFNPVTGKESVDYNVFRDTVGVTSPSNSVGLSWQTLVVDTICNIYKFGAGGVYGLIGTVKVSDVSGVVEQFRDIGVQPDPTQRLIEYVDPFPSAGNFPCCFTYFQQRTVYGGTNNKKETVFAGITGFYNNFNRRNFGDPIRDTDSIEFNISGKSINPVRYLMDINGLVMFTETSEQYLGSGPMTPSSIQPQAQSYNGVKRGLKPIGLDNTAIYAQDMGFAIRELGFIFESDGYRGDDLTVFASHFFKKNKVVDWDYQKIPNSIIWVVRDDGILLSLTHVKEQDILAWGRHDFDGGFVENVCCTREQGEHVVYVIVRRTIGGVTKRYRERLVDRKIITQKDIKFLDSHVVYDGHNTNLGNYMTITGGGPDWDYESMMSLVSIAPTFSASLVGREIHLYGANESDLIKFTIETYVSPTNVIGKPSKTVPVSMRDSAIRTWALTRQNIKNLWHLEGQEVSVFADYTVVGSVHNSTIETVYTVQNGRIDLDIPYAYVVVGLPITADIGLIKLNSPAQNVGDRKKLIQSVQMEVEETRGLFAGPAEPTGSDYLQGLQEIKPRTDEAWNTPNNLITGRLDVTIESFWNNEGEVFIRQVDPLPSSLLTVEPRGYVDQIK